jgi:tRNA 2-thiouridine synthesizing protein A
VSGPVVVDARGLRCPLPVIRLAQAAAGLPDGTELVVLATDPAAEHDVPAWARMRGHTYLGPDDDEDDEDDGHDDVSRLRVRLGGAPPPQDADLRP